MTNVKKNLFSDTDTDNMTEISWLSSANRKPKPKVADYSRQPVKPTFPSADAACMLHPTLYFREEMSYAGYTLHDFSPDFHSPTVLWKSQTNTCTVNVAHLWRKRECQLNIVMSVSYRRRKMASSIGPTLPQTVV